MADPGSAAADHAGQEASSPSSTGGKGKKPYRLRLVVVGIAATGTVGLGVTNYFHADLQPNPSSNSVIAVCPTPPQVSFAEKAEGQFRAGRAHSSSVAPTAMVNDAAVLTQFLGNFGRCRANTKIGSRTQKVIHETEEDFLDLTKRATNTTVTCFNNKARRLLQCLVFITDIADGTGSLPTGAVSFASSPITAMFLPDPCILTAFRDSTVKSTCTVNVGTPARLAPTGKATVTATYSGDDAHSASIGSGGLFPQR